MKTKKDYLRELYQPHKIEKIILTNKLINKLLNDYLLSAMVEYQRQGKDTEEIIELHKIISKQHDMNINKY